ncbi:hypothetical protein D6779_11420 [Candidatus Parcubacteria bacterium]|nr:MAG: hypothetical protein D6779_11420 [Candidatus Parcubacteria bacterium]
MNQRLTVRFLLWVYMLLLGLIIITTTVIFLMYGAMATSTKDLIDIEAHKTAVETFGTVAQSFADLIKVAVGAVIGALGATLQSILSKKSVDGDIQTSEHSDEFQKDENPKSEPEIKR